MSGIDLSGIDLTTEVVRTDRLVLRPYRAGDADAVFAACQDPGIQRCRRAPVPPSPRTLGPGPCTGARPSGGRAPG